MRIWAKVYKEHKIIDQVVQEFASARPDDLSGWSDVIISLCKPLDLSRPVLLDKHVRELAQFGRTVFRPQDFIEPVGYDRFEIELFPEKKKDPT